MQARCQQGTRQQPGWQMKQPPDRRVPRSSAPRGPSSRGIRCHTERSGARGADSEEQSRGEPMHGCGQRTPDLAFGTDDISYHPAWLKRLRPCAEVTCCPPRGLPPHLWSHDMDTFGQTAVNISTPHIACVHTSKSECNHSLTMMETRRT